MKILVFTEGTVLMHASAKGVSREERVRQAKEFGIQKEEKFLKLNTKSADISKKQDTIDDYESYVPVGKAVKKLTQWQQQGAMIYYLTSRRIKTEIKAIKKVLLKFDFPNPQNLLFRRKGEDYYQVAQKASPC